MRKPLFSLLLAAVGLLAALAGHAQPGSPIPDFTFIHSSDCHQPPGYTRRTGPEGNQFGSGEVITQIKGLTSPVEMKPYGVTVPAPSFAIVTGDLTEFGSSEKDGWWQAYLDSWKGAPFHVWHISGNHDSTWAAQRHQIRKLYGGAFYSFNYNGCHFIGWDSASVQDPRPSFGEEELNWLREDLRGLSRETPVFLFCHHPVDSSEFASLYERDRLLDILRPYNLTLLLVGHGHAAQHRVVAGVDQVMGGSTFGNAPGYSVVSVKDGTLRVAYRRAWDPTPARPLLEKPLPARSTYPQIRVHAPRDSATVTPGPTRFRVSLPSAPSTLQAAWQADDEKGRVGELTRGRDGWKAVVDTTDWEPGAHYVRFTFTAADKTTYQRTTRFYVAPPTPRVAWRSWMNGSGKATPVVSGDLVLTGGQDGLLYAFDRKSGRRRWTFRTGGEILAAPLALEDRLYFGSGDTRFYCIDRKGRPVWSYEVGYPVYSGAVAADGKVIVAANNGHIYAFNPEDGARLWECTAPDYSIESRPPVVDGVGYFGCWDGYVYAVHLKDGSVRWKTQGSGSKSSVPGVARYYAPADASPVVAGGKVWIADRKYSLSVLDAATGAMLREDEKVASVALSEDGRAVYLRGTDGNLRKVDLDGKPLWTVPARTSFLPSAPREHRGVVYSTSATGRVLAFDAADGRQLWEYQATPRIYVFSDPVPVDDRVYVTGMDGSVTALDAR